MSCYGDCEIFEEYKELEAKFTIALKALEEIALPNTYLGLDIMDSFLEATKLAEQSLKEIGG